MDSAFFDNLLAFGLIDSAFALPYCVWLLGGYLSSLPKAIEEAAVLDGCNRRQVLLKIMILIISPGIMAAAMYCFIIGWDEYTFALLLLNRESAWNLNVGMQSLVVGDYVPWNQLFTLVVIDTVPAVLLFIVAQKLHCFRTFKRGHEVLIAIHCFLIDRKILKNFCR